MAKGNKPFVQGILCKGVTTEAGHEAINYLKKLGCSYSISFSKDYDKPNFIEINNEADLIIMIYNNSYNYLTQRNYEFVKKAKAAGKEVVLLYKRISDNSYQFFNFYINTSSCVQFTGNCTNSTIDKIKKIKINCRMTDPGLWSEIREEAKVQQVEARLRPYSPLPNKFDFLKEETCLDIVSCTVSTRNLNAMMLRLKKKRLK